MGFEALERNTTGFNNTAVGVQALFVNSGRDNTANGFVRYEAVNAMLLNEFLKGHRKVQEQQATIASLKNEFESKFAQQQKQIEALTVSLQKVTAQIESAKTNPLLVSNN